MKVLTANEMREAEERAIAGGLSQARMMENAGRAVAEAIVGRMGPLADKSILVLVGPGNNGGDGLVAARFLHAAGAGVQIYLWKRDTAQDENFRLTQELGIPFIRAEDDQQREDLGRILAASDVAVDALLGTGLSLPLRGDLPAILQALREERERRGILIVAVDLPTGLEATSGAVDSNAVPADLTVTFAFPKRGHYLFPGAGFIGQLRVADIEMPPSLAQEVQVNIAEEETVRKLLPLRPLEAHKGTFGRTLVVAGSANFTGAAYLASAAATRVGAGLVTLALPASLHPILAAKISEATFLLLPENLGVIAPGAVRILAERLKEYNALLLGPGLGQDPDTVEFVREFLDLGGKEARPRLGFQPASPEEPRREEHPALPPLVIDADGLNILARASNWWEGLPQSSILTPHPGEMSRLSGLSVEEVQADRIGMAQRMAQEWRQVVVLKGAYTLVASPEGEVNILPFANPGLASAGTGDVLAGAIVGFLAQGLEPYEAALVGAYLHGLAGEMAREELGDAGMVAGDLLPLLPKAIKSLKEGKYEPRVPSHS